MANFVDNLLNNIDKLLYQLKGVKQLNQKLDTLIAALGLAWEQAEVRIQSHLDNETRLISAMHDKNAMIDELNSSIQITYQDVAAETAMQLLIDRVNLFAIIPPVEG